MKRLSVLCVALAAVVCLATEASAQYVRQRTLSVSVSRNSFAAPALAYGGGIGFPRANRFAFGGVGYGFNAGFGVNQFAYGGGFRQSAFAAPAYYQQRQFFAAPAYSSSFSRQSFNYNQQFAAPLSYGQSFAAPTPCYAPPAQQSFSSSYAQQSFAAPVCPTCPQTFAAPAVYGAGGGCRSRSFGFGGY